MSLGLPVLEVARWAAQMHVIYSLQSIAAQWAAVHTYVTITPWVCVCCSLSVSPLKLLCWIAAPWAAPRSFLHALQVFLSHIFHFSFTLRKSRTSTYMKNMFWFEMGKKGNRNRHAQPLSQSKRHKDCLEFPMMPASKFSTLPAEL